jgi:hypothetical protein
MIFFYGEGRLGNQVFQLQALRVLGGASQRLVAVGLEHLQRVFEPDGHLVVLRVGKWPKRLVKYALLPLLLRPLARYARLFSYVRELPSTAGDGSDGSGVADRRYGLIRNVTVVDGGYYQSSRYWTSVIPARYFTLRSDAIETARHLRHSAAGGLPCAGVHVRRGDYVQYSAYGQSNFLLPISYYLAGIRRVREVLPAAHVIFVTDDPDWVTATYSPVIADMSVISGSEADDFALLTQCDAVVSSNSTFSLTAALLNSDAKLIVAPRYWLGFREGRWLPPEIEFRYPRIEYLRVDASERV